MIAPMANTTETRKEHIEKYLNLTEGGSEDEKRETNMKRYSICNIPTQTGLQTNISKIRTQKTNSK
jgi:hypothetical protein